MEYLTVFLQGLGTVYIVMAVITMMFLLFLAFGIDNQRFEYEGKKASTGETLLFILVLSVLWIFFLPGWLRNVHRGIKN